MVNRNSAAFYLFQAFLMALALVACATVPKTFNQRLVVAYSSVTAARESALLLLEKDKISVQDAQRIQAQMDTLRDMLDRTRVLNMSGETLKAEDGLKLAMTLLTEVENYLKAKGGD